MILRSRRWRLLIRMLALVVTSALIFVFAGAASYALQDDSPKPLTTIAQLYSKDKPLADTYVNVAAAPDLEHALTTRELLGSHYWIPLHGYGYQLFVRTTSGQYLFPYDYNPRTGFGDAQYTVFYSGKITPLAGQANADKIVNELAAQGITVDKDHAMVLLEGEAPQAYRPVVPVMPVLAWLWLAAFLGLLQIWRGKRIKRTA